MVAVYIHTSTGFGLPVNFTRSSSFCAGRVFIQLVESKLLVNSINVIYKNCVRIDVIVKLFIVKDVRFVKIVTL